MLIVSGCICPHVLALYSSYLLGMLIDCHRNYNDGYRFVQFENHLICTDNKIYGNMVNKWDGLLLKYIEA